MCTICGGNGHNLNASMSYEAGKSFESSAFDSVSSGYTASAPAVSYTSTSSYL